MTEFITDIPESLKFIVDYISITKRYLRIHFISGQIAVETIIQDVNKFKNNIRKELKNNGIDEQKINQIISLIQNNYKKVFPDIEDEISSDINVTTSVKEAKESNKPKINTTFEETPLKTIQIIRGLIIII